MDIFPNWTVFPVVFLLTLLTFILSRTFFRPLGQVLDERDRQIEGARKEAEEIRLASQNRMTEFDNKMREARRQADLIMAEMDKQVQEERGFLISEKRSEAQKMLEQSRAEIQQKTADAGRELQSQSDQFARLIADHILKRPLQKGSDTKKS
jgi:F-type H+-transporting ATPase subunit b